MKYKSVVWSYFFFCKARKSAYFRNLVYFTFYAFRASIAQIMRDIIFLYFSSVVDAISRFRYLGYFYKDAFNS